MKGYTLRQLVRLYMICRLCHNTTSQQYAVYFNGNELYSNVCLKCTHNFVNKL